MEPRSGREQHLGGRHCARIRTNTVDALVWARVRGGVVNRTGDRVGDALEMRTCRVGVEGFVVASLRCSVVASLRTGERSILSFLCRLPAPSFFFA